MGGEMKLIYQIHPRLLAFVSLFYFISIFALWYIALYLTATSKRYYYWIHRFRRLGQEMVSRMLCMERT